MRQIPRSPFPLPAFKFCATGGRWKKPRIDACTLARLAGGGPVEEGASTIVLGPGGKKGADPEGGRGTIGDVHGDGQPILARRS